MYVIGNVVGVAALNVTDKLNEIMFIIVKGGSMDCIRGLIEDQSSRPTTGGDDKLVYGERIKVGRVKRLEAKRMVSIVTDQRVINGIED